MKRFLLCFILSILFSRIVSAQTNSTDYFRSVATGDWNTLFTWESSPDNINWIPATLLPNYLANTISIRNSTDVTLTSAVTADQVVIEFNGVLTNNMAASNAFTINDGTGDDLVIKFGGIYHVISGNDYSGYQTVNNGATVHIETGGIISIEASAGGNHHLFATIPTTFIWDNASIFDWNTTLLPETTGITYFPDATAFVVPVWRFTVAPGVALGGGSPLVVKGVLLANSTIIFDGATDKTFRNGIQGFANVTMNAGAGKLIVDGQVASFGGTGTIIPNSLGLIIGKTLAPILAVLISDKTVNGDIVFNAASSSARIYLGFYQLTVAGTVLNGSAANYIETIGSGGVLTLKSITSSKIFPIGSSGYNPITISSTSGADFSARVENSINPPISFPTYGINRTWNIFASTVTPGVIVSFQYAGSDANPGASPQPMNMEILQYAGAAWNVLSGNTNIPPTGINPYVITSTAPLIINNSSTPYALGKSGGYALPLDYFIVAHAQKRNNSGIIDWKIISTDYLSNFELQRSVNNSGFRTIARINPVNYQLDYSYTDASLESGTHLYRIKVNRLSGEVKYSNTVALINSTKDLLITSISPNPVHDQAVITLSAAKEGGANLEVYDIAGKKVKNWVSTISDGNNTINEDMSKLPSGVYHIIAFTPEARAVYRFVKQ